MPAFLDFIGKNYEKLRQQLCKYKNFDEDVFHNTIIKCAEIISEIELKFDNQNDALRYFIGSYKTNLLRSKLYYHEKNVMHNDTVIDSVNHSSSEAFTDINMILTDISKKFGLELSEVYMTHVADKVSIAELQKTCSIKNLKQKIRNIKQYIQKKYKD